MKRGAQGFSLLELVAVMAVMCILMLIALPTYVDRMVREQVQEALPLADIAKPAVERAWRRGEALPADNKAAGLPQPELIVNDVVRGVQVEDGAIHIEFGNRAHKSLQGHWLSVRPAGVEDARVVPLTWVCGQRAAPEKMTVMGQNRTDLAVGMVPPKCR